MAAPTARIICLIFAGLLATQVPALGLRHAADAIDAVGNPFSDLLHALAPADDAAGPPKTLPAEGAAASPAVAMLKAVAKAPRPLKAESPLLRALRQKLTDTASAEARGSVASAASADSGARLMALAKGGTAEGDSEDSDSEVKRTGEKPSAAFAHARVEGNSAKEEPASGGGTVEEQRASEGEKVKQVHMEHSPSGDVMAHEASVATDDGAIVHVGADAQNDSAKVNAQTEYQEGAAAYDSKDIGENDDDASTSGATDDAVEIHVDTSNEDSTVADDFGDDAHDSDAVNIVGNAEDESVDASDSGATADNVEVHVDTRTEDSTVADDFGDDAHDSDAVNIVGNAEDKSVDESDSGATADAVEVHVDTSTEDSTVVNKSSDAAHDSDAVNVTAAAKDESTDATEDGASSHDAGTGELDRETSGSTSDAKNDTSESSMRTGSLDNATAHDSSRADHNSTSEHSRRDSTDDNAAAHTESSARDIATANHSGSAAHIREATNVTSRVKEGAAARAEVHSQTSSTSNGSSSAENDNETAHRSSAASSRISDDSKKDSQDHVSQSSNRANATGSAVERSSGEARVTSTTTMHNHTAHEALSKTSGSGSVGESVSSIVQNVLDEQDIRTEQDAVISEDGLAAQGLETEQDAVASEHENAAADQHAASRQEEEMKSDTGHFSFARNWIKSHQVQTASEARKTAIEKSKEIAKRKELEEHKRREIEAAQNRTCDPATAAECSSMCRWLKLTDEDGSDCPLFDWQLRACQYALPGQRPAMSPPGQLDCVVNLTRTYVLKADVPGYVQQLDTCIQRVPKELNATCSMAIGLVLGEVSDWKEEAQYKKAAEVLHQELEVACEQGHAALSSRHGEQEAIDRLSDGLSKAERLPGHYLVDEVHKARRVLDKLGPIPVARAQLSVALEDGRSAFETTELFKVKEAIAWLRVAVEKAKEYDVGEPTPRAVALLTDLEDLRSALEVLRSAVFQGNVSLSTKSEVPETVLSLQAAIRRAKSAGLKADLSTARSLLRELRNLEDAVDANANATRSGQFLLNATGNKGMLKLRSAVKQLNGTVAHAQEMGLADNATTDEAVATLDNLSYVSHARFAVHSAVKSAEALLLFTGLNRSDDEEELAIDALGPAIEWGQEVGLHRGLPVAKELLHQLESIEEAKESMNLAIATGNNSLEFKAGAGKAIKLLESAVKECGKQNVTAGVALAERYLKRLRSLQGARRALGDSVRLAHESYGARADYDKSLGSLQSSVSLAANAGLADEARIAGNQLQKLKNFAKADHELVDALQQQLRGHPLKPVKVEDPQPKHPFERTGLKPVDLPQVEGAEDDGDEDFSEHITALEAAIQNARDDGLVDSSMKAQVETLRSKQWASEMLRAASEEGDEALKSKQRIEGAISSLTAAIQEVGESNLTAAQALNVEHATEDLQRLRLIQPARDELSSAILHANVSMHTVTALDEALTRLNEAMKANQKLDLTRSLPKARRMVKALLELKETWVNLKAAVVQGQIALKMEQGEEKAINELQDAVDRADKVNLHQRVSVAVDVLHELMHMNAKKQQLQAAVDPSKQWA